MPTILYDNHLVSADKLKEHSRLLHKIANGEIKAPQATILHGVKYQGYDVAHARINKKERIIYTHIIHKGERTLFILDVLENHNYPQLSRKFKNRITGIEPYIKEYLPKDEELFAKAVDSRQDNLDEKEMPLTYTAVTSYNNILLELDVSQKKAVQLTTPAVILGPPGAGKTAVLFVLLLNFLKNLLKQILPETAVATPATAAPTPIASAAPMLIATATAAVAPKPATPAAEVLFVSPSNQLINNLKNTYEQTSEIAVRFSTWRDLLQSYYTDCTLVTDQTFNEFYQLHFKAGEEPQKVHYELSLFAALTKEDYLTLGKRQSHFNGNKEQQAHIEKLFILWEEHLKKNKLIDPLFTMLPNNAKKYITFCDETQNLPPTALRSLIQHTKDNHFVAALDSEQCIVTSPFIHNCLKKLLIKRFGTANEHLLEQTWRCPHAVVKVANHLMKAKYDLDKETANKRIYTSINSSQDTQGLVSWVNEKHYNKLKPFGTFPTTVVIVAKQPSKEERELIKEHLNCANILTAEQAIGLDFSVVILWKPLSQGPLLPLSKKPKHGAKLTSEQWHGLNSLYVAITRAQSALFVCEERQTPRTQKLLGELPENQVDITIKQTSAADKNKLWEIQIQHHIDAGRFTLASELMEQLGLSPEELKKRRAELEQRRIGGTAPSSQPTQQDCKWNPLPQNTLGEQSSNDEKEKPLSVPKAPVPKEKKSKAETIRKNQEKFDDYAKALLQSPTKESIKKLFSNAKAKKYLFQYSLPAPFEKDSCLFTALILISRSPEEIVPALAECLTREIITGPALIHGDNNVLEFFTNAVPGQVFLRSMLLHNLRLTEIIDGALLCQPNRLGNTALGHLSANNSEGVSILNLLLVNNPGFAQEITAEALCRPTTETDATYANGSALLHLSVTSVGCVFLQTLLKQNPKLVTGITIEALCRPLPKKAGRNANCSPLTALTKSLEGRTTLISLIANKELAKGITAKDLLLTPPKEARNHYKSSLYFLLESDNGPSIFQLLLNANPRIAKEITADDICRSVPAAAAENANYSLLYSLAEKPYAFARLLQLNPELAKGITSEALCRPFNRVSGNEFNSFPLLVLTEDPSGLKILNTLLDNTPNLAQEIYSNEIVKRSAIFVVAKKLLEIHPIGKLVFERIQRGGKQQLSTASQVQIVTPKPELVASATQIGFFPPASTAQPQTAASSGLDCKQ